MGGKTIGFAQVDLMQQSSVLRGVSSLSEKKLEIHNKKCVLSTASNMH